MSNINSQLNGNEGGRVVGWSVGWCVPPFGVAAPFALGLLRRRSQEP